jgi:hypothetical protein
VTGRLGVSGLLAGLRAWTRTHDAHVRAAVELLIGHGTWLRRTEFRDGCVHMDSGGEVWLDWRAAREAFDAGGFTAASSTERAVLDLAIALGTDRYRLGAMGPRNRDLIVTAVAAALGTRGRTGRSAEPAAEAGAGAGAVLELGGER